MFEWMDIDNKIYKYNNVYISYNQKIKCVLWFVIVIISIVIQE